MMKGLTDSAADSMRRNRITEKNKWKIDAPNVSKASGDGNSRYSPKSSIDDELPELVVFLQETDYEFFKDICIDNKVTSFKENYDTKNGYVPCFLKHFSMDSNVDSTDESEDLESSISSTESTEKDCLKKVIEQQKFWSDATFGLPSELSKKKIVPKTLIEGEIAGQNTEASPARAIAISLSKLLEENSHTSKAVARSNIEPARFFRDSRLSVGTIDSGSRKSRRRCCCECEIMSMDKDDVSEKQTIDLKSLRGFFDQNDQREASSIVIDPVSSSVAKSLLSSYSGSVSLRSNSSSTNSSHSFAFPILQREWNGSPERMLKATQMPTRRHRLWRMCFPCFRF